MTRTRSGTGRAILLAGAFALRLAACSDGQEDRRDADADAVEGPAETANEMPADAPGEQEGVPDGGPDTFPELDVVGDGCVPPDETVNRWVEVTPARQVAPGYAQTFHIQANGYGNVVYRSMTGEIVYLDGIMEEDAPTDCFYAQTFYANALHVWNLASDTLSIPKAMNYGGGSYGYGCLMPAFADDPTPSPRHTYEGLVYVDAEDALYLHLGAFSRIYENATAEAVAALDIDCVSTWKYTFADNRWHRIDGNIRQIWPDIYGSDGVSDYESHMLYWPEGNRILFVNDNGNHHAEFMLDTQTWQRVETVNDSPFSLYMARSAWDASRQRWVFRLDTDVAYYDPNTLSYTRLPSCGISGAPGITVIPRWDVYLIVGQSAAQTQVFHAATETWETIDGGDLSFGDTSFIYVQYDPATDRVGLVQIDDRHFWFRYVPPEGICP